MLDRLKNYNVDNWIVSTSAGVALVSVGITLLLSHRRAWRSQKNNPDLDDAARDHYYARFRRRTQASSILMVLGFLIPIGDLLIPWQRFPTLFFVYWGILIFLALWVVLLGLGDALATAARSRIELGRIRRKQRELQDQLSEIRRRDSNGRGDT